MLSDEKPVPKSSSARLTPRRCKPWIVRWVRRSASSRADLGELELELGRLKLDAFEEAADLVDEVAAPELQGRDVDGEPAGLERAASPAVEIAGCSLEQKSAELADQPAILGKADEAVGRHGTTLRMGPAHERLEADHPAAADLDLRLVDEVQLGRIDGPAQIVLEANPLGRIAVQDAVEEAERVAPLRLCPIERHVGMAEQRVSILGIDRIEADPQARGHPQLVPVDVHRRFEAAHDLARRDGRVVHPAQPAQDHDELVATHPRDRVLLPHGAPQPLAELHQERVAHGVAEAVVDRLEPVDIEEGHGDDLAGPLGMLEDLAEPLVEQGTVRQAR